MRLLNANIGISIILTTIAKTLQKLYRTYNISLCIKEMSINKIMNLSKS